MTAPDAPIKFVQDIDGDGLAPGSAEWAVMYSGPSKVAGLLFICPCGCGSLGFLSIRKIDEHPSWVWNGDREKPTMTPSIQKTTPCRWHGYLTDGVFRSV